MSPSSIWCNNALNSRPSAPWIVSWAACATTCISISMSKSPRGFHPVDIGRLDALLEVHEGRTEFARLKAVPRGASLQHMRQWSHRLDWLESIVTTPPLLTAVANTKTQQFAAEAMALDIMDMRRIQTVPRRQALLVCMLHQAQVHTRDQWVEMFTRRMRRTLTLAREKLQELQDQHRALEEHMLAVFAEVIEHTIDT